MPSTARALIGTAERPVLTYARTIATSADALRSAALEPDRLARWFGRLEEPITQVGDETDVQLSDDPEDRGRARLLAHEPGLLSIAWSWQREAESVITAHWRDDADGLALCLEHALAEPRHLAGYGGGWEQVLQALLRELDAAEADPLPDEEIGERAATAWQQLAAHPVEVSVDLPAPPEEVWELLSSAEGIARWWWNHWDDVAVSAEVRPGGTYRIDAPRIGTVLSGTYLAVEDSRRIAATWVWADSDGTAIDEAVDLRMIPDGRGTRLSVRHTGPFDEGAELPENYRQGWEHTLGQLAALLTR